MYISANGFYLIIQHHACLHRYVRNGYPCIHVVVIFQKEEHLYSIELRHALNWGYVTPSYFSSTVAVAVGEGFSVLVDIISGKDEAEMLSVIMPYVFLLQSIC